tara:strand:+ start:4762 stop:5130 length:369 start_codon:yes stop_codon:yes gene_type:complete
MINKQQAADKAAPYLKKTAKVFVTADGNVFLANAENAAKYHARSYALELYTFEGTTTQPVVETAPVVVAPTTDETPSEDYASLTKKELQSIIGGDLVKYPEAETMELKTKSEFVTYLKSKQN